MAGDSILVRRSSQPTPSCWEALGILLMFELEVDSVDSSSIFQLPPKSGVSTPKQGPEDSH